MVNFHCHWLVRRDESKEKGDRLKYRRLTKFVVMKALMWKVALDSVSKLYTLPSSASTWVTTVPEGERISLSTTLRSRWCCSAHSILRSVVLLCVWYLHSIAAFNPGTSWRNVGAFAALLGDGSVKAWGDSGYGGSRVPDGLVACGPSTRPNMPSPRFWETAL